MHTSTREPALDQGARPLRLPSSRASILVMTRGQSIASFTVCLAIALIVLLASAAYAVDQRTLRRAFDALYLGQGGSLKDLARFQRFWSLIDREVISALNEGKTIREVNELLRTFPGYKGPSKDPGVQIGNAVFYSGTGLGTATYRVTRAWADQDTVLLGAYNCTKLSPGRISVYRREEGKWVRVATVDGPTGPMEAYVLSKPDSGLVLATIETFNAANRAEGITTLWEERNKKLTQHSVFKKLVDFDTSLTNSGLRVSYDGFIPHLCESVMGTRFKYELRADVRDGHIHTTRTLLTPWLETLSELYGLVSARRLAAADELFEHPADLRKMYLKCGSIREQHGDLGSGRAWVRVYDGDNTRSGVWRLVFKKGAGRFWKITSVTEEEE